MQDELEAERPELSFQIAHVNGASLESGLPDLYAVSDLPVVQDDTTANVWTAWTAEWRDVIVLDGDNQVYAVYNLTTYDLSDPTNYAELKEIFLAAALAE